MTELPDPIVASTMSPTVFVATGTAAATETDVADTETLSDADTGVAVIVDDSVAVTATSPLDVMIDGSTIAFALLLIVLTATAPPIATETPTLPTATLRLATTGFDSIVAASDALTVTSPPDTVLSRTLPSAEVWIVFVVAAPPSATAPLTPPEPATATATPTAFAVIVGVVDAATVTAPVPADTTDETTDAVTRSEMSLRATEAASAPPRAKVGPTESAMEAATATAEMVALSEAETVTSCALTVLLVTDAVTDVVVVLSVIDAAPDRLTEMADTEMAALIEAATGVAVIDEVSLAVTVRSPEVAVIVALDTVADTVLPITL